MSAVLPHVPLDGIAAYVPLTLRHQQTTGPRRGAFLAVDIVGFGAFAEKLGREGVRGAERLSELLNRFFGRLVDVVHAHGGDVWQFAGDAAHVVWFAEDDLSSSALSAARCALEMQRVVALPIDGATSFRARVSIGAGALEVREVGGVDDRWFPLLTGDAIAQAVRVDRLAQPGDVLVSQEAWASIQSKARGSDTGKGAVRLVSAEAGVERTLSVGPAVSGLERFVLPAVVARLAAGQAAFLAELRSISIVFVQLVPAETSLSADVQGWIAAVQEEIQKRDGAVYQCLQDDKGLCVVAAFGLPMLAHEDDARRSVEATVAVRNRLGCPVGIGVATGQMFCGDYGNAERRQYSLIGTTINLAARLMHAAGGDGLLCDAATTGAARGLDFVDRGEVVLKSFAAPIRIYEPRGRRQASSSPQRTVGRRHESEVLRQRLKALQQDGIGGIVALRGEPGIGKSMLLRDVVQSARELGIRTGQGATEAVERQTPLYAWRSIVAAWLPGDAAVEERLRGLLGDQPELLILAPLLSNLLGVDLPDNELTRQMTGQVRADNLQRLLIAMASRVVAPGPLLLAIEDAHWMDSASWSLAQALRSSLPNVLIVTTLRPVEGTFAPDMQFLDVKALDATDIAEVVRLRLGVRHLPASLVDVVASRATGNPLYAEEIALALLDTGVIEVHDEECRLVGGEAALAAARIPATITATILSRVDRLEPDVLLTLKVASVIGPSFALAELTEAHPFKPATQEVDRQLSAAARADMIVPDPQGYAFRHALIQETTYGLLPFAQRRDLHRAVAEQLEARADATHSFGRLAYHWEAAEVPVKAVDALAKAGRQAMDTHAHREAISFLSRALTLDGTVRKAPPVDLARAEWQGFIGQAHYGLMEHESAVRSLRASIESAGFVFPTGGPRILLDLARFLGARWWPPAPSDDSTFTTRCLVAHRSYSDLGTIYLWMGKKGAFAHEALAAGLALSRVAPCGQVAYQHAGFALLMGLAGMRGAADRDFQKAIAIAESSRELLGIASAHVLYGMFLVMTGRPADSLPIYARSVEAAEKLYAGLWRHRALHMSGEGSYFAGQYAASRDLYRRGALVAEAAERHVTGLAHTMAALATLRLGDADAALKEATAPDGLPVVRENPVPLSLFASLGAVAEIQLARGDLKSAREATDEAEAILKPGQRCDDYFAGIHGHAGVAAVRLVELEQSRSEPARRRAAVAVQRMNRFARLYPGASPRAALLSGRLRALSGSERRARKSWVHAIALAKRMQMPFESGRGLLLLGRSTAGAERHTFLSEAAGIFAQHGMRECVRETEGLLNS